LAANKSFVFTTCGFTCITFSVGALMWWGPQFAYFGAKADKCASSIDCESITQAGVAYKFGIIMTFAGLLGVPLGSYVSQIIRPKVRNADPLISGYSLLVGVPILYAGLIVARTSVNWCYFLTFIAGLLLNANWAVVGDMTMYIVIPPRRSMASAAQILASHALGDAISPYLVGLIADWVRPLIAPGGHLPPAQAVAVNAGLLVDDESKGFTPEYYDVEFRCLQYALFMACFLQTIGALFFFWVSFYVLDDKRAAQQAVRSLNESGQRHVGDRGDVEGPATSSSTLAEDEPLLPPSSVVNRRYIPENQRHPE